MVREQSDEQRAVSMELEQARYEERLCARRYEGVDPDNRLVDAELEARWNASLARVRELEVRFEQARNESTGAAAVKREDLFALANDLPSVWNSDAADMRLKQRIVRLLIREVVADVDDGASEIVLVIHWIGGRHTELRIPKNRTGQHGHVTSETASDVVRRMAGRWPDEQIAATLNRLRLRTGTGNNWNEQRVYQLRRRLGLLHLPAPDRTATPTILTLDQAAEHLGVSARVVRKMIERRQLSATQAAPSAPWEIPVAAVQAEAIRRLATAANARGQRRRRQAADARTLKLPGLDSSDT
jgi:hypothetical protein